MKNTNNKIHTSVQCDKELLQKFAQMAKDNDRSVSSQLRLLMKKFVNGEI